MSDEDVQEVDPRIPPDNRTLFACSAAAVKETFVKGANKELSLGSELGHVAFLIITQDAVSAEQIGLQMALSRWPPALGWLRQHVRVGETANRLWSGRENAAGVHVTEIFELRHQRVAVVVGKENRAKIDEAHEQIRSFHTENSLYTQLIDAGVFAGDIIWMEE